MSNWFSVDKAGLAAILERKGKEFALLELVQNAWDSGSDRVEVTLEPIEGKPFALLTVEDWGEGFADLSHANTMFARSSRAGDPTKRGRFNLGEKLVLAVCRWARIDTTTGGIDFREDGTFRRRTEGREVGTRFEAEIRMTRQEYADVCEIAQRLIPPVETKFNGKRIDRPDSLARFAVKLPTEIADADGTPRKTVRLTDVEVYEGDGEILEMGVPVVEAPFPYRVNVLQKIPQNMDRDNVTPAFMRAVQVAVLNAMADQLPSDVTASPWVQEAMGDARASVEAVKAVVVSRFGDKAVTATVGDPLANANAEAAGFTVIPGGAMSGDAWANIRKHGLLLPASKVFPGPTPQQLEAMASAPKCPTCGK